MRSRLAWLVIAWAGCYDWGKFSRHYPPQADLSTTSGDGGISEPDCGSTGTTYYVAPSGSDSAPGTQASPLLTIQAAADRVNPGDTVIVASGTYAVAGNPAVYVRRSGSAGACITFRAAERLGAKLDGKMTGKLGFYLEGAYLRVDGFEVTGFGSAGITAASHDLQVIANDVHDINAACSEVNASGVYVTGTNVLVEGNRIHDTGVGCSQNQDQGVDLDAASDVVLRNNVFYGNSSGWDIQVYSSSATGSTRVTVANNTFAFANPDRSGRILLAGPSLTTARIVNNLFYRPTTAAIQLSTAMLSGIDIQNNLIDGGAATTGSGSVNATGNLENADAKLVDPNAHDFHLQAGSAAIDAGLMLSDVTQDFDGVSRPQGGKLDIGAFERR